MTDAVSAPGKGPASRSETARRLALHLLCFVLPLMTLAFLLTAPHPWYFSLPWLGGAAASVLADFRGGDETRQPPWKLPGWPFDSVLYLLVALQLLNVGLFASLAATHGFLTMDTLVGWQLVGISSGYSGIVVAHELIHRRTRRDRLLGRALLCTVMYEHFYTEHIRGHHARVATPDDPATARFGESYHRFFWRTVPSQFRHAWRLEATRLGDVDMKWWDPRHLRSQVVHGLAAEWGLALAILGGFGWAGFAVFLAQAFVAVRLLEAVNFFEHWGLRRAGPRVRDVDSWDTTSRFTLYTLVGLSRHADHHVFAARPYQALRHREESPKLPRGYFGMVLMVFAQNRRFQEQMSAELERCGLGPFAPVSETGP